VRAEGSPSVEAILSWLDTPADLRPEAVRAKLREWVPEYTPSRSDRPKAIVD